MKKLGFAVISFVVMLFIVSSSSFSSSPMEELEGTLEIMVATNQKKECQTLYSIKVGKERIPFDLPARPPPNLSSGQKIKIAGRWNESDGKKEF